MPDDLASALARIERRAALAYASPDRCAESQADIPAAVRALRAALGLAGEWEREGTDPAWQLTNEDAAAGVAGREHASALRAVITRALNGDGNA